MFGAIIYASFVSNLVSNSKSMGNLFGEITDELDHGGYFQVLFIVNIQIFSFIYIVFSFHVTLVQRNITYCVQN